LGEVRDRIERLGIVLSPFAMTSAPGRSDRGALKLAGAYSARSGLNLRMG